MLFRVRACEGGRQGGFGKESEGAQAVHGGLLGLAGLSLRSEEAHVEGEVYRDKWP